MAYTPPIVTKQSAVGTNSTTTPLSSAATFTGTGEQVNSPQVMVVCKTDNTGTLYFDFSPDGTNWDSTFPVNGFKVASGTNEFHTAVKGPRYFRVRLINDSGAQSYLRLYTYYGDFGTSNTPVNQSIGVDNDATVVRLSNDHKLDIARSFISGQSVVHKFGSNPLVAASSTEDISYSGTINFLTAATTVRIKSGGNAADDSSGAGAQKVMIEGLNSNWADASEEVTTAGASASSATTTSFVRVFRAYVTDVGTYGVANTGDIVIENSAGGTDLITIEAGMGQTETSLYTVPAGKTAYLTRLHANSTSAKASDIFFWQRQNADDVSTPFTGKRLVQPIPGLSGSVNLPIDSYPQFPAKTDIWASVTTGSGATGAVSIDYDIVLVDN